jgi:hypothetical protein
MRTEARPAPTPIGDVNRTACLPFAARRLRGHSGPPDTHRATRGRPPRWALAALLASLGACYVPGGLRVVQLAPSSGELALVGERSDARVQAERYMQNQCPAGHFVLDEGEAPGPSSRVDRTYAKMDLGAGDMLPDAVEWRVRYRCKETIVAKPPPPAPAPKPAPTDRGLTLPASTPPPPSIASAPPPPSPAAPTAPVGSAWF